MRIVWVDVFVVLYDADTIKENDVQGTFGAEECCRDVLAPRPN